MADAIKLTVPAAEGFVQVVLAADHAELFFECEVKFDPASPTGASEPVRLLASDDSTWEAVNLQDPGTTGAFTQLESFWTAGSAAITGTLGVWHTVRIHYAPTEVQTEFDAAVLDGPFGFGTPGDDSPDSDIRKITLRAGNADTDTVTYFRAIKVGTTLGGTELFEFDPTVETDLSAFTSTLNAELIGDTAPASTGGGVRVGVAFDDPTLEPSPVWTYLTDTENLVAGYTIDAGRQYEFDKTDTSTAHVTINDVDGVLDPTNTAGPYYGLIEPLLQIQIELYNPVTESWSTRYRGFIEDYDYTIDPSQVVTRLEISCVDLFAIETAIEMQPDGSFGDTVPAQSEGNIFFDNASAQDRISQVLGNAGIPPEFYVVFTLNVDMQESVYSPSENVLQVVQDAADAEFPTVSNVYVDRTGRQAIHGRLAKFDPEGTAAGASVGAWLFTHWKAGDGDAVTASPTDTAHIRTLAFNRGLSKVFNSCFCTPNGIAAADVAGQLTTDGTSIGQYGIRSWSAENLLIDTGTTTGNTGLQETLAFATFIKNSYKQPHNRISEISFRTISPDAVGAAATWALLAEADIADLIDVTETSPGGGGFTADTWFIEGRHETAQPLNGVYADVTLTLDVSPGDIFIGQGTGLDGS